MVKPRNADDIVSAYLESVRLERDLEDRLRVAAAHVARLQTELAERHRATMELRPQAMRGTVAA